MSDTFFIASYVAQARPEAITAIEQYVTDDIYAELHAVSDIGKMVIVFDAPSHQQILDSADNIRNIKGVISFLPVYQHAE